MRINNIPCGSNCVDRAAISPAGDVMALAQAPQSSLKIFDIKKRRWLSWWRSPRVKDVDQVAVAPFRKGSQVLYHRSKSNQVERFSLDGVALHPIELPERYDLAAMKVSYDGGSVAIGDSFGNVLVHDISSIDPHRTYSRHFRDGAVYSLAWSADDRYLYLGNALGQLLRLDLVSSSEILPLHREKGQYTCFSICSHPQVADAFAFGGDGNRVWLVNLPFALEAKDGQPADSGFPVEEWQLDMGNFADRWSLKRRIFLPRVDPEKAAWIDTNLGTSIRHLHLTRDWHLMVVGETGMEVWNLRPLQLVHQENWRAKFSQVVFASCETVDGLQVVREQ